MRSTIKGCIEKEIDYRTMSTRMARMQGSCRSFPALFSITPSLTLSTAFTPTATAGTSLATMSVDDYDEIMPVPTVSPSPWRQTALFAPVMLDTQEQ